MKVFIVKIQLNTEYNIFAERFIKNQLFSSKRMGSIIYIVYNRIQSSAKNGQITKIITIGIFEASTQNSLEEYTVHLEV